MRNDWVKHELTWRLILIVGGIATALLLLEGGLRLAGMIYLSRQEAMNQEHIDGSETRILCLGESTTAYGGQDSYPRQLERILNRDSDGKVYTVINAGVPGTNTDIIVENLAENLDKYRPDIVITMMGINDEYQKMSTVPEENRVLSFLKKSRVYKLVWTIWRNANFMHDGVEKYGDSSMNLNWSKRLETYLIDHKKAVNGVIDCYKSKRASEKCDALRAEVLGGIASEEVRLFASGVIHEGIGEIDAAAADYNRALEINPAGDSLALPRLERIVASRHQFGNTSELPKATLDNYMFLLLRYVTQFRTEGQCEEALNVLRDIRDTGANSFWIYHEQGLCELNLGEFEEAAAAFRKCIEISPENHWGYGGLAMTYLQQGRKKEAYAYFRQADSHNYDNFVASTRRNYRILKKTVLSRGLRLICVQYPVRSVKPLMRMLAEDGDDSVLFVDNQEVFLRALDKKKYQELFFDHFAGDFGHCTPEGNRILAENIARTILGGQPQ